MDRQEISSWPSSGGGSCLAVTPRTFPSSSKLEMCGYLVNFAPIRFKSHLIYILHCTSFRISSTVSPCFGNALFEVGL